MILVSVNQAVIFRFDKDVHMLFLNFKHIGMLLSFIPIWIQEGVDRKVGEIWGQRN